MVPVIGNTHKKQTKIANSNKVEISTIVLEKKKLIQLKADHGERMISDIIEWGNICSFFCYLHVRVPGVWMIQIKIF